MLWLTVRNWLVQQNIWRYKRGVAETDVVLTGFAFIMFPILRFFPPSSYKTDTS
jgi:hypothetical protein